MVDETFGLHQSNEKQEEGVDSEVKDEEELEGDDEWFMAGFDLDENDTSAVNDNNGDQNDDDDDEDNNDWNGLLPYPYDISTNSMLSDLPCIMKRIGQKSADQSVEEDYQERSHYILGTMGSLALVRGAQGDVLREAGAMQALLSTLTELWEVLPTLKHYKSHSQHHVDDDEVINAPPEQRRVAAATLELAKNAWGAIRDLSCGNADNRRMARLLEPQPGRNGIRLATDYLERYHEIAWIDIPQPLELGLMTAVVGVMRNLTHATGENSRQLHANGVTDLLLWRLLYANDAGNSCSSSSSESGAMPNSLPQTNLPWRGACFRAAGTLVNMAEKCHACALQCARHAALIHILAESWGGLDQHKKSFYLHPGLAAIIESAQEQLPPQEFAPKWQLMLEKEKVRKRIAQQVEEERKRRLLATGRSPF